MAEAANVLDAYCAWADGSRLPDAEAEAGDALAALLRRGPEARRQLVEYALLEAALHRVFVLPPPMLPWWRRPLGSSGWTAGLLLLAAIIGGAIAWQNRGGTAPAMNEAPPRAVALVASGQVLVGGKISADVMTARDLQVPAGAPATVRLRDGSTIVLHPGSRVRMRGLDDVDRGFEFNFASGGADFHVVRGHRELRVNTPYGGVEATGPEFTVSIDEANRQMRYAGPLRPYGVPPPPLPPAAGR